jgi:hypothetical protein
MQQLFIAIASSLLIMRINRLVVINNNKLDSINNKDKDKDKAKATCGSVDLSSTKQDANLYSALLTQDTDLELYKLIILSSPE